MIASPMYVHHLRGNGSRSWRSPSSHALTPTAHSVIVAKIVRAHPGQKKLLPCQRTAASIAAHRVAPKQLLSFEIP